MISEPRTQEPGKQTHTRSRPHSVGEDGSQLTGTLSDIPDLCQRLRFEAHDGVVVAVVYTGT